MAYVKKYAVRLPPGCGADRDIKPLYNPYIHDPEKGFMAARRLRFCLNCKTVGSMTPNCEFTCKKCGIKHETNLTAPRLFDHFSLLAGRGGGKTLAGAWAALEEIQVPNSIGWIMAPDYKWLHDSTFPTFVRRINPDWVQHWDSEHMEIKFKNGAMVAFRSLEDPERARGPHNVGWGWFDEAAQCPERAYHVFLPCLAEAAGIVIATTTVLGFDWTYDCIEKQANMGEPGFWAIRWWTEENPLYAKNPTMKRDLERKKKTTDPEFFAQEYRAERRIGTLLVYPYKLIEEQTLTTDEDVRKVLPEWPNIDSTRQVLIGIDEGADHPFGAVMIVVTPAGLVVVNEYMERMQAISQHLTPISHRFGLQRFSPDNMTFAANKNALNLRLEWGLKGVSVQPAESKHEIGIQRVNSWLAAKQIWFVKSHCPRTIEQMQAYRYANNKTPDGQKKREEVFKQKDELPDGIRYALMAFPELPDPDLQPLSDREQKRWNRLDERSRHEIERMREFNKKNNKTDEYSEAEFGPVGEFFNPWDGTSEPW